jgi:hypothetical protein
MNKRQLIDEILLLNQTADPAFLARFSEHDLADYLHALTVSLQDGRRPAYQRNRYTRAAARNAAAQPAMAGAAPGEDYRTVPGQRSLF